MTEVAPSRHVAELHAAFASGLTRPPAFALAQLAALTALLDRHGAELERALAQDLGKSAAEAQVTELLVVRDEVEQLRRGLQRWRRPRRVPVPGVLAPAQARIRPEPKGVVLVIAPWNYPVQLSLSPLAGALAAGNAVLLKPSELAPATSAALAELLPRYLDPRAVRVVTGDAEVGADLLTERFDHIVFTGSARIGRAVLRAAAEHLTPVTLELGGKSPCFVDRTADLAVAARRIAWGRFLNAGQTCVAPDYVLAPPEVIEQLIVHLRDAVTDFFGVDPATSPDYGRIVDDRHFARLAALLTGDIVIGGQSDAATRYVAPTVIRADAGHPAMAEEIFGPVLPLVAVSDHREAIAFVQSRPRPLALYVFTAADDVREDFTERTASGALGINVPVAHLTVPGLPFGGVGESGMGAYHARHSVAEFSHHKAVLAKPLHPDTLGLAYPPYRGWRSRTLRRLLARRQS